VRCSDLVVRALDCQTGNCQFKSTGHGASHLHPLCAIAMDTGMPWLIPAPWAVMARSGTLTLTSAEIANCACRCVNKHCLQITTRSSLLVLSNNALTYALYWWHTVILFQMISSCVSGVNVVPMICRYCKDWRQATVLPAGSCTWWASYRCTCW